MLWKFIYIGVRSESGGMGLISSSENGGQEENDIGDESKTGVGNIKYLSL